MSGRITSTMLFGSTLNDIGSALASLERSSSELSSGRSILKPSDDPYGSSRAIELQSQLDGLDSYAANVQDGISWASTASSALTNIGDIVQRVRELLVQASNGVYDQSDHEKLAAQIDQLTESIKQDANTKYGEQYIFSGTLTSTAPYLLSEDAYQGNAGQITRAIGPGAAMTISPDISSVLGAGQGAGDGKLLDTLRTISEHLRGGTSEDMNAISGADLKNLDGNIEALIELQAGVGTTTQQLQTAASRIEDLQGAIGRTLSDTQDADLAKTAMAYSNEQAAYDAALRAGAAIVQESLLNFLH